MRHGEGHILGILPLPLARVARSWSVRKTGGEGDLDAALKEPLFHQ